ncbi:bifunctional [glutamine synthetase] adenylyltransferase/[glutamine synthetase]-adenylyl-L-tyrosine phosphorylase [Sphingomonas sp. SORGH_AS_0879]|uniref:bifunctional [glutamine synthetase] adenylyltransferase/[glutamine synthetase]-adenylyl-L-tyrosine phosphorylase n=1 Tax=Sphingomonas sp. SORGH_AS_0879 TaxID=3041790 RepID=UPI00277D9B99|nr:bifunctional [glutamine synthetase] adenylyltransferase/[glutamine synthetase]-adenylyl-L-tyrosine phosphorylase [Sphingomonas sp. SORGH_AS_0879]MDQ1230103.1 glutamate-ammonia-ligase adenylyltransferase [Sphingomonas sp. SORGH_AS_0879]
MNAFPASGPIMSLPDAVARARRHSSFLAMLLDRERGIEAKALDGILAEPSAPDPDLSVGTALRRQRRALALTVALGDLAGVYDLTEVTGRLTDFADHALDRAIRAAIEERTPGAEPVGFAAIALGKQGSRELNYSSDIDPILLFDPKTLPHRPREEPEDAAVRIAKRVVELLQARDGEGYVLRVDLRLRPSPEATPIAIPVEGAIAYYESQALTWERAAFIRARAAAGDMALGQRFLDAIRPFVWRRALDFGAVGEIRDLTHRIRDHHAQGQAMGPGYDLKRGRGGIREIEFFAQIHQLIHGGRDPALRAPATRDALARLAEAGRIDAGEAAALSDAYVLLRTIEHRVQMIDDRQTHQLPLGDGLGRVAQLHGLADGEALVAMLAPVTAKVGRFYDALDVDERPRLPHDPVLLNQRLAAAGLRDIEAAARRIAAWRGGDYAALRSPAAREALDAVLPTLVEALGEAPDPDAALLKLDSLFERMTSAINIFRLLEARPGLASLTVEILSHAAPLAGELARRPALLDGLIDASAFEPLPAVEHLERAMRGGEAGQDYQDRLDHVRRVVGELRFALGAQIVAGRADPLEVAGGYARVAEAAVGVLAQATVDEFVTAHGRVPDSELVILALGRMGGAALTHASDLDLVYLFTGDFAAESDGPKPLGATLYYNRLAQRVTAALSVPTQAGPLYPVDTRLRPSGTQGPLVVSVESFARYQREDAWTWEHMALTRARPIYGSAKARKAVASVIADVLNGNRPPRDVAAEAGEMRTEMARHKPPQGPLDVKLLPGGLVDLEFAVHRTQLTRRTGFDPDLGRAIAALVGQGLMPPGMATAYDVLTRALVAFRLLVPDGQEPPEPTRPLITRAMGLADWDMVVATLEATRQEVGQVWQEGVGDGTG